MSSKTARKKTELVGSAKPALVGLDGGAIASNPNKSETKVASQLPRPVGWQILIAIPEVETKTTGGILKADSTMDIERTSSVLGLVLAMGGQCFNNKDRFGDTPWCKDGDFVMIGAYQGVRFHIHGKEFRLINDDTVKAIVADPRGHTRA